MEFKHTPGPWKVIRPCRADFYYINNDRITLYNVHEKEEHLANLNLIASAPELLKDVVSDLDAIDHFIHLVECNSLDTLKSLLEYLKKKKVKLITKATGGQI